MKIIHCSDIHLDSKMETSLPEKKALERNYEIYITFEKMIRFAREHEVKVIIIAGDLFDTKRVSSRTVRKVLDVIAEAKEIDFLYLKGNHDENKRLFDEYGIPENLKLFRNEWTYYDYGIVGIAGVELNRDNCISIYNDLELDKDKINFVVLHGQESRQEGEDLVSLKQLQNKGIHYLALGHIHSYKKAELDEEGVYCYSGCLEGRGFDECGEKGFVLIEADERGITSEFVPFAKRMLHEIKVDITNIESISEIINKMKSLSADIPSSDLVKFTLTGSFLPETDKDISFIQKALESDFYFVKIKDESRLKIDDADYRYDKSLKGEFIRMVLSSERSEEEKEQIICCGLAALKGEKRNI